MTSVFNEIREIDGELWIVSPALGEIAGNDGKKVRLHRDKSLLIQAMASNAEAVSGERGRDWFLEGVVQGVLHYAMWGASVDE